MQAHTFVAAWRSSFGEALPAGFLCRRTLADRWLRIHSLPGSKRYADTTAERTELLYRQNAAADYVLGSEVDCQLIITRLGEKKTWSSFETVPLAGRTPEHLLATDDDGDELQFFGLPVCWRKGSFDELLAAVADDRTGSILFANVQRQCIYAPYDGGADLFFPSHDEALLARVRFRPWLSPREDGL